MLDYDKIDKVSLKSFFDSARQDDHHVYAFLAGLPKAHFYLSRFRLDDEPYNESIAEAELRKYTVGEFLEHYDDFDPCQTFGLCWVTHLDRIYSDQADDYADGHCIEMLENLNVEDVELFIDYFLEKYCEKCLYDNRPFEMDAETIAAYGFTEKDVSWFGQKTEMLNGRLKNRMRQEYETLCGLDFIRRGEQGTPLPDNARKAEARTTVPRMVFSYIARN